MKCLILGGAGQVGRALIAAAPTHIDIAAPPRALCDITDTAQLEQWIINGAPELVFNAAGYTDVNGAESHPDDAVRVNSAAPAALAALCRRSGARLVHLSTDYVFDGAARAPYTEDAHAHPLNVYGRGKYESEQLVRAENSKSLIVRTSWVYADRGRNFVNAMLTAMREKDEVGVVADQTGAPTYARNLAHALWRLAGGAGIYHFSDGGHTTWYGFACAIREEALALGLLAKAAAIIPVASADYHSPAKRPAYSVLDNTKIQAKIGPGQDWRDALTDMLKARKSDG